MGDAGFAPSFYAFDIASKDVWMTDAFLYLSDLGPAQLIGVVGFLLYLLSFGSVQLGWLDVNSLAYSLANILAASLVAISLTVDFNLSAALIQGSWIILGVAGLALRVHRSWPRTRKALATTLDTEISQ